MSDNYVCVKSDLFFEKKKKTIEDIQKENKKNMVFSIMSKKEDCIVIVEDEKDNEKK